MKFISTLLLAAFFYSANCQTWKLTTHYSLGLPQQQMASNIQPVNSFQFGILYKLPGTLKQLSVGIETGIGSYASKRIDQTFQFDNNTASVVPVSYISNVFNLGAQARLNLLNEKYFVVPYITAKGGMYNFFSTIHVDDPNDPNGCHALVNQTIISDKTGYWSAGGGLQIDPGLFSKNKRKRNLLIDIGATTIHGGTMNYINTKHLADAQTMNDPGGKPVQMKFINASSQQIHEHTVAQVFNSNLRLIEFNFGIVVGLGK